MNAELKRNLFNRHICKQNLTATQLKVLMLLESFTDWHNGLSTSPVWDGNIQEMTGLRRDKIRTARESLVKAGILNVHSEGLPAANYIYTLNFELISSQFSAPTSQHQGTQIGSKRNPTWVPPVSEEPNLGLKGTQIGFPPPPESIITKSGEEPNLGLKGTQIGSKRNLLWVQKEPNLGTLSTKLSSSSFIYVNTTTNLTLSMRMCLESGMHALTKAKWEAEENLKANGVFENLAKEKASALSPWMLQKYCRWLPWICRDIEKAGKKVGSRGALLISSIEKQWGKPNSLQEHEKTEFIRKQKKTEKDWEEEQKRQEYENLQIRWEALPDEEKFRIFRWIGGKNLVYAEALKEISAAEPLKNIDSFHRGLILGCFREWNTS